MVVCLLGTKEKPRKFASTWISCFISIFIESSQLHYVDPAYRCLKQWNVVIQDQVIISPFSFSRIGWNQTYWPQPQLLLQAWTEAAALPGTSSTCPSGRRASTSSPSPSRATTAPPIKPRTRRTWASSAGWSSATWWQFRWKKSDDPFQRRDSNPLLRALLVLWTHCRLRRMPLCFMFKIPL